MTTYIVACDYDEYWMPIAATNDEKMAAAIKTAAIDHVYLKMKAKHEEVNEGDEEALRNEKLLDELMERAKEAIIIAYSKPPFVPGNAVSVPQIVFDELDHQISEYDLLGQWG